MNVLITGASGMIGSELLSRLMLRTDLKLRALCRSKPVNTNTEGAIEWVQGDLLSISLCDEIVADIDLVFHLAHPSVPLSSSTGSPGASAAAIEASLNLLNAMVSTKKRPRLVFASSGGAVYSGPCSKKGYDEKASLMPTSVYGIEKMAIEHHIRLLTEYGVLRAVVLRVANAYGRLLPAERKQGFIGTALSRALKRRPIRIIGSLDNVRDYVHLDDLSDAFERCIDFDTNYETLNIGTGVGTSVRQLIDIIEKMLGYKVDREIIPLPALQSLPPWSVLDPSKCEAVLDWRPTLSVTQGIQMMLSGDGLSPHG